MEPQLQHTQRSSNTNCSRSTKNREADESGLAAPSGAVRPAVSITNKLPNTLPIARLQTLRTPSGQVTPQMTLVKSEKTETLPMSTSVGEDDNRTEDTHLDGTLSALRTGSMQFSILSRRPRPSSGTEAQPPFTATSATLIVLRETYLLKVCRALMMYGAPTYRLEEYMHKTGESLKLGLQSFYIPGCMIISFQDSDIWLSKEVHIVRTEESLNLCKLDEVHRVYKDVIHDKISIEDAISLIDEITVRSNKYPPWVLVLLYGLASACVGPFSYGARPIDLPIIFMLGALLGVMQLIIAERSPLYRHVFEISATILTSFVARAFGSINLASERKFCFAAIAQACLVMILPGFTITNSALELQSKNMVSGAVRMVYGIIFTLFLAFGIMIGTTIYGAMDSHATSATRCITTWPFWWQIIFVPPFTVFYVMINQGKWKHMPAMVVLSVIGWTINHFATRRFQGNQQIAPTLAAIAVGILANTYSRFVHCLAYSLVYPAIFVQVPGSFAASGSLLSGLESADMLTRNASDPTATATSASNPLLLTAGYTMIEIAIALTVGLSVSALVVYPFRKTQGKSGIFSF